MAERLSRRLVLMSSAAIGAVYLAGYLDTRGADASLAAGAPGGTATAAPTAAPSDTATSAAAPPATATTTAAEASTVATSAARRGAPDNQPPALAATPTAGTKEPVVAPAVVKRVEPTASATPIRPTATPVPVRPTATPDPARPAATPAPVRPTATPAAAAGYRDGMYTGLGTSRRGDIQVALTVSGGRIARVAITDASTQYPTSWIAALPRQVVATQSDRVDLVSGATYSSLAFEGAVRQALAQASA